MSDKQRTAREVVDAVLSGWIGASADTFSEVCSSDVRWWMPYGDENLAGAADIQQALVDLVGAGDRLRVDAEIVADDGSVAVVEMSRLTGRNQDASPVTSVIMIEDGCVVSGRTYFDVASYA